MVFIILWDHRRICGPSLKRRYAAHDYFPYTYTVCVLCCVCVCARARVRVRMAQLNPVIYGLAFLGPHPELLSVPEGLGALC